MYAYVFTAMVASTLGPWGLLELGKAVRQARVNATLRGLRGQR